MRTGRLNQLSYTQSMPGGRTADSLAARCGGDGIGLVQAAPGEWPHVSARNVVAASLQLSTASAESMSDSEHPEQVNCLSVNG